MHRSASFEEKVVEATASVQMERYCKLVNSGGGSRDAAMWAVLSELDSMFSLNEDHRTVLKVFILLMTGFGKS